MNNKQDLIKYTLANRFAIQNKILVTLPLDLYLATRQALGFNVMLETMGFVKNVQIRDNTETVVFTCEA